MSVKWITSTIAVDPEDIRRVDVRTGDDGTEVADLTLADGTRYEGVRFDLLTTAGIHALGVWTRNAEITRVLDRLARTQRRR